MSRSHAGWPPQTANSSWSDAFGCLDESTPQIAETLCALSASGNGRVTGGIAVQSTNPVAAARGTNRASMYVLKARTSPMESLVTMKRAWDAEKVVVFVVFPETNE